MKRFLPFSLLTLTCFFVPVVAGAGTPTASTSRAVAAPPVGSHAAKPTPTTSAATTSVATTSAATAPVAGDALTDQARELHLKGAALFQKGEFAQAEAAFLAAWAIKKHFQIAANLGACELKLGKARAAAEHLAYAVRTFTPPDSPERETTMQRFAEARAKVASVTVIADSDGADVLVDGVLAGSTPLADPVFVDPGAHTIELRRDGEIRASANVTAKEGGEQTITLSGKKVDPPQRGMVPAYVFGGAGVVAAAVGAGLLIGSREQYSATQKTTQDILANKRSCVANAPNYDPRCPTVASEGRTVNVFRDGGIVALSVAGAAAATAAIYVLWPTAKAKSPANGAQVVPVASPTMGGVVFSGRF